MLRKLLGYFTYSEMTKLAAIFNVWDGVETLRTSMLSMKNKVDVFIIVFQNVSNFGEYYAPLSDMDMRGFDYVLKLYKPEIGNGFKNETAKRNLGLQTARELECTHFLFADCDEIYENFDKGFNEFMESGKEGSACQIYTYFKSPTLRFENFDNYFVPFIHKLNPDTMAGTGEYPFYVDPTRKVNCKDVCMISEPMHHFSYVRKDIRRKIRNSSARANIEKSNLLNDYNNSEVGPGFYVADFRQRLISVENIFNIDL